MEARYVKVTAAMKLTARMLSPMVIRSGITLVIRARVAAVYTRRVGSLPAGASRPGASAPAQLDSFVGAVAPVGSIPSHAHTPRSTAASCANESLPSMRTILVGERVYLGTRDFRTLATTVKFGSTTLAISYSSACPMNIAAPRSVSPYSEMSTRCISLVAC